MKELKDMTLDELMLYRASVEAYGTSRELYEIEILILEKKKEKKFVNGEEPLKVLTVLF